MSTWPGVMVRAWLAERLTMVSAGDPVGQFGDPVTQ
jgi:hypothetical protein